MGIKEDVIRKYVFGNKDTVEGKILKVSISKDGSESGLSIFDLTATINEKNEVITNHGEEEAVVPYSKTWTYLCKPKHRGYYLNKAVTINTAKLIPIPVVGEDNNDGIVYSIKLSNEISNSKTKDSKINGNITTINTITSTVIGKITASSTFYILVLFTNNATIPIVKAKHLNGFNISNPFDEENNLIYNSLNEKVNVEITSDVITKRSNDGVSQRNIPEAIKKMEAIRENENIEYNEDGDVVKYENTATGISYTETHDHDGETEKIWRLNNKIIDREYTRTYANGAWVKIKDKHSIQIMTGSHNMNYIDLVRNVDQAGNSVSAKEFQKIKDKYRIEFATHGDIEVPGRIDWSDGSTTILTVDDESTMRTDIIDKTISVSNYADAKTMKTIINDHDIDIISYVAQADVSRVGYHLKANYSDISGVRYNMDTDTYFGFDSNAIVTGYSDDFVTFGLDKSGSEVQVFHSYLYSKEDMFDKGIYMRDEYGVPHKFKIATKTKENR